jgi:hypothetical protein
MLKLSCLGQWSITVDSEVRLGQSISCGMAPRWALSRIVFTHVQTGHMGDAHLVVPTGSLAQHSTLSQHIGLSDSKTVMLVLTTSSGCWFRNQDIEGEFS